MALSINRLTNVITVPQSDLSFVSGTLYEHDTETYWFELKAIEAGEEGIVFDDMQSHNLKYTVAGVTYAQKVEMINGFQVEYEDLGHPGYTTRLVNSNNNIFEEGVIITNHNSVIGQNSAGLIIVGFDALSEKLDELLGLNFKFSYRHTRIHDNNKANGGDADRLISEKLDTYTSDTNVRLHDGVTGLLAKYEVEYTYPATTEDKVLTMLFTRVG